MEFVLNVNEIIDFFDGKKNGKYSNAVVILLGEELCSYLFKKYMKEKSVETEIYDLPCKKQGNKGKQLDRWIKTIDEKNHTTLYQTEIKTWNSNGAGGKKLASNATEKQINEYGLKRWKKRWKDDNTGFSSHLVDKVLDKMFIPPSLMNPPMTHLPLLLFWEPICNTETDDIQKMIFFEQNVINNNDFNRVYIFCVSTYLRYLSKEQTEKIPLPKKDFPLLFSTMEKINKLISD